MSRVTSKSASAAPTGCQYTPSQVIVISGTKSARASATALGRSAAQRNMADHPVPLVDLSSVYETTELLGLTVGRYGRRQPHAKSLGPSPLDASPCAHPGAVSAMLVVPARCWAVEADLQSHAIARQRAQRRKPPSREEHAVGEDRRRRRGGARRQDLADVGKHKGLAAGHEDFADAEVDRFVGDPLDAR